MVNLIVVFPKKEDATAIRNLLVRHGYDVLAVCTSGGAAIQTIDQMLGSDGIIVSGFKYKDMSYRDLYQYLPPNFQMLVMASSMHMGEIYEYNVVKMGMPVKTYDLLSTLRVMEQTMVRNRRKRREKAAQRSDAQKELLEHAKSVLIENKNMTEDEAHRYIQKKSMDNGTNMVETAQMVIELFSNIK